MCKRYEWEDALCKAQASGLISNGALLLALKMATQINWKPKSGDAPGLYNATVPSVIRAGASRPQWFKHRESLLETGFITIVKGNVLPKMPEESLLETLVWGEQSLLKTDESLLETVESPLETPESLLDNPLSVDTLSEDSLSEESLSEGAADATPAAPALTLTSLETDPPLTPQSGTVLEQSSEDVPESLVETLDLDNFEWDTVTEESLEASVPNQASGDTPSITEAVSEAPRRLEEAVLRSHAEQLAGISGYYSADALYEKARELENDLPRKPETLVLAAKHALDTAQGDGDDW